MRDRGGRASCGRGVDAGGRGGGVGGGMGGGEDGAAGARKRAEEGGWQLDRSGSGFTQLGADGTQEVKGAERGKVQQQTSLFFDAVAAQVL